MSILTAEGLFPALPLPPVQVQRGQGQEEVLGGSEGHLVLRRARGDGLKSGSGGVNTLQERRITPHGCQMAKFDPFLSLDCARVEGVGRNPRKGRDQILQRSIAEP